MGRKSLVALPVVMPATVRLLARQGATIKVSASETQPDFQPVWAWVGHDDPITPTTRKGLGLFTQLSRLSPSSPLPAHPRIVRSHRHLGSGRRDQPRPLRRHLEDLLQLTLSGTEESLLAKVADIIPEYARYRRPGQPEPVECLERSPIADTPPLVPAGAGD